MWGWALLLALVTQKEPPPTTPPVRPEMRLQLALTRMKYLEDSKVVDLGVKVYRKILVENPDWIEELSQRSEIKDVLLAVMKDQDKVAPNEKIQAAEALGETKLLALASSELLSLMDGDLQHLVVKACRHFATKYALDLPVELADKFIALNLLTEAREIAIANQQDSLVAYVLDESIRIGKYDYFYGIDSTRAADLAAQDFLLQLDIPAPPTDLVATRVTEGEGIVLTWVDHSQMEEKFVVERSVDSAENFVKLQELPSNTVTMTDTQVEVGKTYRYRVSTLGAAGKSEPVESAPLLYEALVPPPPPDPVPEPTPEPIPEPAPGSGGRSRAPMTEPRLPMAELIKIMLLKIDGHVHEPTARAWGEVGRRGRPLYAVLVAERTKALFTRPLFDEGGLSTSLGLSLMDIYDRRSEAVKTDYSLSKPERDDYSRRLKDAAVTLKNVLVKDQ